MTLTTTAGSTTSTTCRPRFATPRDFNFPTWGPEVGAIAKRLGTPLMPWQQDDIDVAYEYDPVTGLLRYGEVDETVPRQSGKTTLVLAKKVHRLTVMARRLGPQRSTYTAQTRLAARKKLERDFAEKLRGSRAFSEVASAKARPSKSSQWRLSLNNGSEAIQFGSGNFLQIDAPSRTGGHGDTLDDGTIDEAFSQEDDTVEMSMRPAMATRKNAQLWVISTAGDDKSYYLWGKIVAGREAVRTGHHGGVCYREYSAPEGSDPGDPATWWGCMPALGITVTEDFVRGEWDRAQRKGQDGIDAFCRAYLNMWPKVPILGVNSKAALDVDKWGDLADPDAILGRELSFGVAVAPDGSWSCIAFAWRRPDGQVQVQVDRYAPRTDWLAARARDLRSRYGGSFTVNTAAHGIIPDADEPSSGKQAQADVALETAVIGETVRHGNQAELNVSVRAARWKSHGDTRAFDMKGSTDISPLRAASLAVYGLTNSTASRPGNFMAF